MKILTHQILQYSHLPYEALYYPIKINKTHQLSYNHRDFFFPQITVLHTEERGVFFVLF